MAPVSHQTIRLAKGKHHSPDQGACVMELASMLAGEPFSDHPHSVSRPIGAFLRRYNDLLDEGRRQDLYRYAAKVVGTAAGTAVEDERIERLLCWADELWMDRRWAVRRLTTARRRQRACHPEAAASYAIRAIPKLSNHMHSAALRLVDELIAIDSTDAVGVERFGAPVDRVTV